MDAHEDNCMVMVHNNGDTYWAPYAEKALCNAIGSYQSWEIAFRVFSDIFTRKHPHKATELIQYNHIIYTASITFPWVSVYKYDKDFRLHVAKYPTRSWSIILQTSWNLRLVAKNSHGSENPGTGQGNSNLMTKGNRPKKDVCYHYNSGRCSFGLSCKFYHRCAVCGKHNHGANSC